jgi:hypothetical protein
MLLLTTFIAPLLPKATATPPPVTTSYYVRAEPARIQEGLNTTITVGVNGAEAKTTYALTVNVTNPAHAHYSGTVVVSTNSTGSGSNSTLYYGDFSGGANTNYVGTYTIAVNETLATGNFTVGLTNAIEYYRFQVVSIRAANYIQPSEYAWANITWVETRETVFSENVSAVDGVIEANWTIPSNALLGNYTVTVVNSTMPGTIKPVPDTQNFTVIEKIMPISIYPTSGSWGTPVRVEGEIVKPGGSYRIKWDNKTIKTGNCGSGSVVVNDTFIVPPSVNGPHNITLYDVNQTTGSTATFDVITSCYVSAEPARVLEGFSTTVTVGVHEAKTNATYTFTVNVTDPTHAHYSATLVLSTNSTGSGSNSTLYYGDFSAGANTNSTGKYNVTVIASNEIIANWSFIVGLTDELEYRVTNEVIIRGSGYEVGEFVSANITCFETGETVFSESSDAIDGTVSYKWAVPENATVGIYTLTLSGATPSGTVKTIPDIQNFTVVEIIVYCQARNEYDNESLTGVTIEACVGTTVIASGTTNETGWVDFQIDLGNYNFTALWQNETVGSLSQGVTGNATFYIECELAHVKIAIIDESHPPQPLPFINITLVSNKTGTLLFTTNFTGTIALNTFTNISYTIEARRYGYLFNTTLIENLTSTLDMNITCPTYTLFAQVLDSNGLPLQNVQVKVYEWESERLMGSKVTNNLGSATFGCTFGIYTVRVYDLESGVMLNETVVSLIENLFFFVIHCRISNVNLSVVVEDYFGHPIPNAKVQVERDSVEIANLTTESNGTVSLYKIIGGNCKISVYVRGELCETTTLYLDETKVVVFKLERFVVFGGYPLETTQLVAGISLGVVIALFALALIYRRLRAKKVPEEKSL